MNDISRNCVYYAGIMPSNTDGSKETGSTVSGAGYAIGLAIMSVSEAVNTTYSFEYLNAAGSWDSVASGECNLTEAGTKIASINMASCGPTQTVRVLAESDDTCTRAVYFAFAQPRHLPVAEPDFKVGN